MKRQVVVTFLTIIGIQMLALDMSTGALASGCEAAYRARISELSGKIDGLQGQLAVSSGSAAATEVALSAAAVITTGLGIMAAVPIAGLVGYDIILHEKRKAAEHALELLIESQWGEGIELNALVQKLEQKKVHARAIDIAAAINRHDSMEDFCKPQGFENKPKLAGVKQITNIIRGDLSK